jgi:hypothetical protein
VDNFQAATLGVSGTTTLSGLTASTALALNGSKEVVSVTNTGTGNNVLATSPTLTTPVLGAATATSINGLTISTTTGTLTLANGSTLATSGANSLTLTTTGATNVTFPTSGTLATTGGTVASFSAGTTGFTPSTATTGAVTLAGTLATTNGGTGLTSFTANQVFYASSTSAVGQSANLTFNGTTLTANALTVSTGNLTFSGTAQRITGDMTNATVANRLAFQTSTTNGGTIVGAIPNGTSNDSRFIVYSNSDPNNSSTGQMLFVGTSDFSIRSGATGTGSNLPMTFFTGGSERVRVDTSGNVGIGTASPGQKLTVAAATNQLSLTTGTNELIVRSSSTEAALYTFQAIPLSFYNNNTERMRIDASGNVGIGTASPSGNLQVSAANTRIRFTNTAGTASALLFGADSGSTFLGAETNAPVYFITNNTERMRIDASGNVGIGTASPGDKLTVSGANALVRATATSGYGAFYANGATGSPAYYFFGVNGTETARISSDASNNIVFNTGSGATQQLAIASTGGITSASLADAVGYKGTPLNEQSTAYTLVIGDQGKSIVHPISDNNARTFTIPANGSVAYPVGTTLTFINMINTLTISITTDTM